MPETGVPFYLPSESFTLGRMDAGLCGHCRHAKKLANDRGSEFLLCTLAEKDPAFRRYPALPVVKCEGHAPDTPTGEDPPRTPAIESREPRP